jgi:hypothetical protein
MEGVEPYASHLFAQCDDDFISMRKSIPSGDLESVSTDRVFRTRIGFSVALWNKIQQAGIESYVTFGIFRNYNRTPSQSGKVAHKAEADGKCRRSRPVGSYVKFMTRIS